MDVTEHDRLDLYRTLEEVLPPVQASTLMELLPRTDPSALATRHDLVAQGTALRGEMAELRADIDLRLAQQTRTILMAIGGFAVSTWLTLLVGALAG